MRKIVMLNRISVDGFFAGSNGEIDWFIHDPEVDQAAHEMMSPDTILFGRETYQMFENYWPLVADDPDASESDRDIANELNQMTKIVFSKSLKKVAWENSRLVKGDLIKEVNQLHKGKGPDIAIFGSGRIVQQLAGKGLIDEFIFNVTPVVLGRGKSLFNDGTQFDLTLLGTRHFDSGNALLHYRLDQ